MFCVSVKKSADHALVLRVMFPGLALEELDAPLAQRDRDFDPLIPKDKLFRAREKVRNDSEASERFVRVLDFLAHTVASLSASTRLQKSESRRRET